MPSDDSDHSANQELNQTAHPRSLVRVHIVFCPHEKSLHTWLPKMRSVKILIRLRECAGDLVLRNAHMSKGTFSGVEAQLHTCFMPLPSSGGNLTDPKPMMVFFHTSRKHAYIILIPLNPIF